MGTCLHLHLHLHVHVHLHVHFAFAFAELCQHCWYTRFRQPSLLMDSFSSNSTQADKAACIPIMESNNDHLARLYRERTQRVRTEQFQMQERMLEGFVVEASQVNVSVRSHLTFG